MSELIYSRGAVANAGGKAVENPRFFEGPIAGVTRVYLDNDLPKLAKAYAAAGVEVASLGDLDIPALPEVTAPEAKPDLIDFVDPPPEATPDPAEPAIARYGLFRQVLNKETLK